MMAARDRSFGCSADSSRGCRSSSGARHGHGFRGTLVNEAESDAINHTDVKLRIRRVIGELEAIERQQAPVLAQPETCSSICISEFINLTRRLLGCAAHGAP